MPYPMNIIDFYCAKKRFPSKKMPHRRKINNSIDPLTIHVDWNGKSYTTTKCRTLDIKNMCDTRCKDG